MQAGFTFAAHILKMIICAEGDMLFCLVDIESKFGRKDNLIPFPFKGTSQDFLTVTGAIGCSSVKEVDSKIECGMNRANRLVIVNIAPTTLSIQPSPGTADCPAT